MKFLQRQRERKAGIPAIPASQKSAAASRSGAAVKPVEKNEGDGEKEDLVLQDTFAQETAVMVEDPNMYFFSAVKFQFFFPNLKLWVF